MSLWRFGLPPLPPCMRSSIARLRTIWKLRRNTMAANGPKEMARKSTSTQLSNLRELMKKNELAAYLIPSEDAHQSEYIAPCDARREFISGFTGSAGFVVVTLEKAALATDGRYFNQAEKQLDDNWTLLKQGLPDVPTWQQWTLDEVEKGKVGVDATLLTARMDNL